MTHVLRVMDIIQILAQMVVAILDFYGILYWSYHSNSILMDLTELKPWFLTIWNFKDKYLMILDTVRILAYVLAILVAKFDFYGIVLILSFQWKWTLY